MNRKSEQKRSLGLHSSHIPSNTMKDSTRLHALKCSYRTILIDTDVIVLLIY